MSSLTIDSVTADDCGKYAVRVDNGIGNDYHFAWVAVEGNVHTYYTYVNVHLNSMFIQFYNTLSTFLGEIFIKITDW